MSWPIQQTADYDRNMRVQPMVVDRDGTVWPRCLCCGRALNPHVDTWMVRAIGGVEDLAKIEERWPISMENGWHEICHSCVRLPGWRDYAYLFPPIDDWPDDGETPTSLGTYEQYLQLSSLRINSKECLTPSDGIGGTQ